MSGWIIALICVAYIAIGIIFNGAMNEEWEKFSFVLMLFWPLALAMFLIGVFLGLFLSIGEKIKGKWL
jgi:O-antigen/teichoic acid export membrane protein